MRDTFPAKQLGLSQALTSIGAIIGPSIGPTLGGVLTDQLSWNWVFYINILPGIAAALLCAMLLAQSATHGRPSVDGIGLALMATGLARLQYVLDEGERYDWFDDRNLAMHCGALRLFAGRLRVVGVTRRSIIRSSTCAFSSAIGRWP